MSEKYASTAQNVNR